ncbi:MAG: hypothetical protein CM1200mP22_29250 [Dehalococcoidia bacterium]|nr:MAG: hypothetical protein CM1200mP22_29250 [Dehalococcoidia bacterium]
MIPKGAGISSFEKGAREMRYAFRAPSGESYRAKAVPVGHTSDDLRRRDAPRAPWIRVIGLEGWARSLFGPLASRCR